MHLPLIHSFGSSISVTNSIPVPHTCVWTNDPETPLITHPSLYVCQTIELVVGSVNIYILSPIWDPIPPIRCHTGSIGMVANYYLTLASLMAG